MTALLFKIIPAIIVFILTMGIIDIEKLKGHPFFKGIIALLTAISTLLLSDQIYSLATGEQSTVNEIMKDVRGDKGTSSQTKDTEKVSSSSNEDLAETNQKSSKWNPKIYRGERSYTKHGSDKVKDNYTGLIWQRKGSNGKFTHPEAEAYCKRHGMRLPTIEELYYLADVTQKDSPKIDNDYFDIKSSWYWSSTPYRDNSDSAWVVFFFSGYGNWYNHTDTGYVLCVSGQ